MKGLGAVALAGAIVFLPGAFSNMSSSGPASGSVASVPPMSGAEAAHPAVADDRPGARADRPTDAQRSRAVRGQSMATRGGEDDRRQRERLQRLPASDAIIAVASDVSPEWGDQLHRLQQEDPDGLRRSIATNGRRLVALAVLRDQEPELYRLKVMELRIQAATEAAVTAYRESIAAGDQRRAAALLEELRRQIGQQVDHDLRTRAEELAALDMQVRRLKDRLAEDAINRDARVAELLTAAIESGAAPILLDRDGTQR